MAGFRSLVDSVYMDDIGLATSTYWDLILIEHDVVWETGVVHPGHGLTSLQNVQTEFVRILPALI